MELTFGDHLIPRELWNEYGIPRLTQTKRSHKKSDVSELESLADTENIMDVSADDDQSSEEEMEQDINLVSEPDLTNTKEEGKLAKIVWKGKEYIEDYDEYLDKELVILKANSGK